MDNHDPQRNQENYFFENGQGGYDPVNQSGYTPVNGQSYYGQPNGQGYTPVNGQGYYDQQNGQGYTPVNGQIYYGQPNGQGNYAPWNGQPNYGQYAQGSFVVEEKHENVLMGIVGALIFALAGGVVWFLLDLVNFVAGISGAVGVYCAIQGYKKFAGRLSKKGVIISAVIAMLVLVFAWYLCFVKDVYQALKEAYGTSPLMPSFSDCFTRGFELLKDSEIAGGYWGSLAIGLGLAVLGAFGTVTQAFKEGK